MDTQTGVRVNVTRLVLSVLGLCLLPLTVFPVYSDHEQTQSETGIVPARIRTIEGGVTLQREQEQDRVSATPNLPVFAGDVLWTGEGRVEVQFPDGSLIWLAEETRIEFLGLSDPRGESRNGTVLRLRSGLIGVDYRGNTANGAEEEFRIDTTESSAYLLSRGRFRLESGAGTTVLTSRSGVAELAGDDGSVLVRSGQRSRNEGGSVPESPWAVNTLRLDEFDRWCEERAESYLSGENYPDERGYIEAIPRPVRYYAAELDYYGDWQFVGDYGWVWRPTVYQVGWRPYFNGYWTWCPGGWTWVAYEPWGWVPYHYGRWNWVSTVGWIWIPGGVYSGAWVSWAVTPTYVGWCPLDFYNRPAYVHINITNVTVNRFGGAWNFLPLTRLGDRNAARVIVKPDRVPQLHGAVTTRTLPRFSPEEVRTRPEVAQRVYRQTLQNPARDTGLDRGSRQGLQSFRLTDRREAALLHRLATDRPRRQSPGVAPRSESSPPRGRSIERPAPSATRSPASAAGTLTPREPSRPGREVTRADSPGERSSLSRTPVRPRVPRTNRGEPSLGGRPSRPGSELVTVRPRRSETSRKVASDSPAESEDPSRRVLGKILRDRPSPEETPDSRAVPRGKGARTDRDRPTREQVRPSRSPPPASRGEALRPRAQAPRREALPPRKQEDKTKKKDKP